MSTRNFSLLAVGVAGLSWVFVKIRRSFTNSAPLGYEDEAGFHFGTPLKKK